MLEVKIRPATEADYPYIYSSWARNYQPTYARICLNHKGPHRYDSCINRFIKKRLESSTVAVACDPDDDEFIIGWAVFDQKAVYYCYVRESMRNAGVAKKLLGDRFRVNCALWTDSCSEIDDAKPGVLRYRPEVLCG